MWRRISHWYFFVFVILGLTEKTSVFCAEIDVGTPWGLSIAAPESNGLGSIHLRPTEHFHVVLENKSKNIHKIWKDTNSWGYAILYFELSYENGTKKIIRKQPRTWRKNVPKYWSINFGEYLVYDVFLANGEWDFAFPRNIETSPNISPGRLEIQSTYCT